MKISVKLLPFLLTFLLLGCSSPNQMEIDAQKTADFMCKTRAYVAKISEGEGDNELMEEMGNFENKYKGEIRSITKKYPIHTEEGMKFMDMVNKKLEKCSNPAH